MGLYRSRILPWLVDKGTSHPCLLDLRRELVAEARGTVLEIGFGPGGSIPHYTSIDRLYALEPEPAMLRRARRRIGEAAFPVQLVRARAERLPFQDQTFDTVVSIFSLCSMASVVRVLHEVQRVLRPEGAFLFLEHGRAHDFFTAQWQRRLSPVQRFLFGCRSDLSVDRHVIEAGLRLDHLDRILLAEGPALTAQLYRGTARLEDAQTAAVPLVQDRPDARSYEPVHAALAR
ncbi:MAG TPA: methyltransferase domain-containing protein [Candidatus Polarisedimenticolaceae bacterium]|nr:methyltransferase domain-containing protein [Candidatus Polarisedimenticolaceae bacterium]